MLLLILISMLLLMLLFFDVDVGNVFLVLRHKYHTTLRSQNTYVMTLTSTQFLLNRKSIRMRLLSWWMQSLSSQKSLSSWRYLQIWSTKFVTVRSMSKSIRLCLSNFESSNTNRQHLLLLKASSDIRWKDSIIGTFFGLNHFPYCFGNCFIENGKNVFLEKLFFIVVAVSRLILPTYFVTCFEYFQIQVGHLADFHVFGYFWLIQLGKIILILPSSWLLFRRHNQRSKQHKTS